MDFKLDAAIAVLERTPTVLNSLLLDLPEQWVMSNEGPETWSPFDVVGHLIHGEETDWIPRTEIILADDGSHEFEVFDRFAQGERSVGKSLNELLQTFETLRAKNLETLKGWQLTTVDLERKGIHPEFGEVTLLQLLSTWVVHDLSHIAQINRVMCKQYGDAVGPWKAYLPILTR